MFAGAAPAVLASNADKFAQNDPIGWMMAIISMSVVFSALVILFLCFKYIYPLFAMFGLKMKKSAHRKKQFEQITDRRTFSLWLPPTVPGQEPATTRNARPFVASKSFEIFFDEDL